MKKLSNEIILYDLGSEAPYYHFLKYAYKYGGINDSDKKINYIDDENIKRLFPFINSQDVQKTKKQHKNTKVKELSNEWFKNKNESGWKITSKDISVLEKISGIYTDDNFKKHVIDLIPGSFGMQVEFKLSSPYYSKDDEEFYIIDNPILKDRAWKIPMVRGSAWKGSFFRAACKELNNFVEKEDIYNTIKCFSNIVRIFGTGSEEIRMLEKEIDKHFEEGENEKAIFDKLIRYGLEELGVNLMITRGGKSVVEQVWIQIKDSINVKKGRMIFYPTYFDKLSLEVINPHNSKTKAGSQPIYYEIVPENTKGNFQILYIPYDAVITPINGLKKQIQSDIEFTKNIIEAISDAGIGAKSKLGWGRFAVDKEKMKGFCNLEGVK